LVIIGGRWEFGDWAGDGPAGTGRGNVRHHRRTIRGPTPTLVNAVAPGLIDTPLWNAFGPQREAILA
jgi:hypothetical protein